MNGVTSLFAAAPAGAFNFATEAAKVASTPFELLLQAAQGSDASAKAGGEEQARDEGATFEERLARQLQELLASLGVQPNDQVTLSVSETGDVLVDGHRLANDIETAINDDGGLKADLQQLIDSEALFDPSPLFGDARLEVEVAEGADVAILRWR